MEGDRNVTMSCLLVLLCVAYLALGKEQPVPHYSDYKTHPCLRTCVAGAKPMTCEYDFTMEHYYVLTKACYNCPFNITDCSRPHCVPTDGVHRALVTINRMMPGPSIQVCHNDMIVVHLKNKMDGGDGTAVHWHGIFQHGSQHMDGVSMLTQCPIPAGSTFEYRFKAGNTGTHFWHSHTGVQRSDGVFGSIVIRQPDETNPHATLYQHDMPEHVIIVHDWLKEITINRFAGHHLAGFDNKPQLMLINGHGSYQKFTKPGTNETAYTPKAVFKVKKGQKYRFRVINPGILNCPIQVSVDEHQLMMIASDGVPFVPRMVDSFNIFAGERFDFVLWAHMEIANYWFRVRGLADCAVKKANQAAILKYEGADDNPPPGIVDWESGKRAGILLNPLNHKATETMIQMADLESAIADDPRMKETPDKKIYIPMDFYKVNNFHFHDPTLYPISSMSKKMHLYSPQMSHISLMMPPSPPLMQYDDIPQDLFCDAESLKVNCSETYCYCIHRIMVNTGDTVEIIFIDEGVPFNANHPMHLHGYNFRVVAMDRLGESTSLEEVQALDNAGGIVRNLKKAVAKDTITVPDGGYSVVRFVADNPGFWFLHCHIEFHLAIGMGAIVQVGQPNEMPRPPKGWPKCGSWKYTGEEPENKCLTSDAAIPRLSQTCVFILCLVVCAMFS